MKNHSELVSVVIPNWNGRHLLEDCLTALAKQSWKDFEIIIVDNGSHDDSVAYIESAFPLIRLIKLSENTGFAKACNLGIKASQAKYIVLLNNDTAATEHWLEALVKTIKQSPAEVGCLASKMLRYQHSELIDDAGDMLTWRGGAFKRGYGQPAADFAEPQPVMFPCAGAALYRRHILETLDGFDEHFFTYLEDIDLGLRIRLLGYTCEYVPAAEILHIGHGSNIARKHYIFFTTRNRGLLFLKNIPFSLLIKKLPALLYGWMFFLLVHRGHWYYLRGTLAILKHLPHIFRERRKIKQLCKLSNAQIDQLLMNEWPEVSLSTLLRNTLSSGIKS